MVKRAAPHHCSHVSCKLLLWTSSLQVYVVVAVMQIALTMMQQHKLDQQMQQMFKKVIMQVRYQKSTTESNADKVLA
jgi:hypothetical protein